MTEHNVPNDETIITSATNPQVKLLRSLDRKKGRKTHNAFLAEGARLIGEGLRHGWEIVSLISGPDLRDVDARLVEEARDKGARILRMNARLMASLARKDNPQTVLASFRPQYCPLDKLPASDAGTYLALYQVRDPGNLGTILRTADFAGVRAVILVGECCDLYSVEAVRASMGSLFAMPVFYSGEVEFLDWAASAQMPMIAASMNGTSAHHDVDYTEKSLLLMGNEQAGLPTHFEAACDHLARIPMREGADSLNLGIATALMIYAALGSRGYVV